MKRERAYEFFLFSAGFCIGAISGLALAWLMLILEVQ